MFSRLFTKLLNVLRRFAVPVNCPKCGHKFVPFADRELQDWREFIGRVPCPKCGRAFGVGEDRKSLLDNPPGPFEKPVGSRIERWETEDGVLYHLPSGGHWGGLAGIAIIWNLFVQPLFYFAVIKGQMFPAHIYGPRIICTVFWLVGVGLLYAMFSLRFATWLLHLGPEEVRLRRSFITRTVKKLPNAEIDAVRRVEAYTSGAPDEMGATSGSVTTFMLEIAAGFRNLRFGSSIPPQDQHWLAWEIREYLRAHGAVKVPEELTRTRRTDN